MPFSSVPLPARRTTNKSQRYLDPWLRNSTVSNCLVLFLLATRKLMPQRTFAARGSSPGVKGILISWTISYYRTTLTRSGWLKNLPVVRNTSIVPYPSHSTCPGWEKERDKVFAKCYNNAYNYCDEGLLKNFGNCVKGLVGGLLVSVMDWLYTCSHLSCLLWLVVEVRLNGIVILPYLRFEGREVGDERRQGTGFRIFYPVLQNERKDVLVITWGSHSLVRFLLVLIVNLLAY